MNMRISLLFFLCAWMLHAAEIDTMLLKADGNETYYDQVSARIDTALSKGELSATRAAEARTELQRVRRSATATAPIEQDPTAFLPQAEPTAMNAYHALAVLADARLKAQASEQTLAEIRAKLDFLKQRIDRITVEEKPRLLSFQLQYAYYKLQQGHFEFKQRQFEQYGDAVLDALKMRLPELACPDTVDTLDERIARLAPGIDQAAQRKTAAEISLEQETLEGAAGTETLLTASREARERYFDGIAQKLDLQTQLALCLLTQNAKKPFFALLGEMQKGAARLDKERRPRYREQETGLRILAQARFGTTSLVLGNTLHEFKALMGRIGDTVSSPLFVFNERAISLLSLMKAMLILIAGFFAGMYYKRWIVRLAHRWPDMSQMSLRLASNIGYYLIVIIALILAVGSLGIDMSSISLIAGALSIGIGFGLQTVVSNFIAGIILMFERTIRIGDTIEINDQFRGRVTDMRIRSTTVKTFDNIDVVVPNSSFIQNNVINWTLEDATRRIHIPFGVAYGTDVEKVKTVVLGELAQSSLIYIKDDPEKMPEVWMVAMNSSSVDFELLIWIEWANKYRPNALRSDFLILIYNALYKHGIQIPFPQLDLYVKQFPGNNGAQS